MFKRFLPVFAIVMMVAMAAANSQTYADGLGDDTRLKLYKIGDFDGPGAEITAYDPTSQRLFVTIGEDSASETPVGLVDILDINDPSDPELFASLNISETLGLIPNSVAVFNGVFAVAAEDALNKQANGQVVFFDPDGNKISSVAVGALPDMLIVSPDGSKILVANEGEPNSDYTVDPEGSISIIDISGDISQISQAQVQTADFQAFNGRENELRARGVRIFPGIPGNAVAQDVEPEYIAITPDGSTAFATLQEANAVAVIDIAMATVKDILPLGVKDHSQGPASLQTFPFTSLPDLGMTAGGQTIKLGGMSGLWYEGMDEESGNHQFVTVPDRGPNGAPTDVDNDGAAERPFALPDYQARVVRFNLTPEGEIEITQQLMLTRGDGVTPITGLPNIPEVDEEPVDLYGDALPYDEMGADLEGVVIAPDGSFWMVDEYRPAIYHFDETGKLLDRFVPIGTAALAGQSPGTFGMETLPAEYARRRPNRGFEAIALDTDTGILYAFIQTPLANPNRAASDDSNIIRMLGINPTNGDPIAEYIYLLEKPSWREFNVDKIGDAVYADDGRFFVIERDDSTHFYGKKFIFEVDLKGATNLLDASATTSALAEKTLEQHTADELVAMGVHPVFKHKVLNLPSIGYLAGDKPEGLTLLPDGRLAVLNDNDFGLLDEEIPGDGTVPLNSDPTLPTLGLISLGEGNRLDASDRDGDIRIRNWPVFGNYMPDSIIALSLDENSFYLTANEGDSRDYDGFSEEERIKDLDLDTEAFPNASDLQENENLGRLKTSNQFGDLDRDGDFDRLYSYGARSFSIWDAYGNLVYDSGDAFEQLTAGFTPELFNSGGLAEDFDSRSDDKGPEAEGAVSGMINGRNYAFIGLERIGGIMIFDVSNPKSPFFVNYEPGRAEHISPEGLNFVAAAESPNGVPLLVASYEVSGSVAIFEIGEEMLLRLPLIMK